MKQFTCEINFEPDGGIPSMRLLDKNVQPNPGSRAVPAYNIVCIAEELPGEYPHISFGAMIRHTPVHESKDKQPYLQKLETYLKTQHDMSQHLVVLDNHNDVIVFDSLWDALFARDTLNRFRIGTAFVGGNIDLGRIEDLDKHHERQFYLLAATNEGLDRIEEAMDDRYILSKFCRTTEEHGASSYVIENLSAILGLILKYSKLREELVRLEKPEQTISLPTCHQELVDCLMAHAPGHYAEKWIIRRLANQYEIFVWEELRVLCEALLQRLHPMDRVMWWKYAIKACGQLRDGAKIPKAISEILARPAEPTPAAN